MAHTQALFLTMLLFGGAAGVQQSALAHPEIDFEGKLYRAVFTQGPGTLSSGDLASVPDPLRDRMSRFLIRRSAFKSSFESSATSFEEAARDAKKRALERTIVSLVEHPDASRLAIEFLTAAPIAFEWEGSPDGPIAESSYAEKYLERNPSSPLAPVLNLLIAHRQRAAFEACEREKKEDGAKSAAAKYLDYLKRARSSSDGIYGLIADDLDRQPYVYITSARRPQDVQR
jgi:hypothetical protein